MHTKVECGLLRDKQSKKFVVRVGVNAFLEICATLECLAARAVFCAQCIDLRNMIFPDDEPEC